MKTKLSKRIRTYLRHEEARCKSSTIVCYRNSLRHFCGWLRQSNPRTSFKQQIARLTVSILQDYLAYLNEKNLAPYTKVNYLLSVKKYLQWEVMQETLKEGVLSALDRKQLPKVPEYLPRPLSTENDHFLQERLRRSPSPYAPLFLLLRQTGLRISELINLPTDCVIKTSDGNPFLKVPLGKMNNERLLPLSQGSLELIEKIRTEHPLVVSSRRSSIRLIGLSGSIPKVYHLLAYHFKQIVGDLNDQQKPITFHRLRHTYATSLLSAGVGLASLMKLLGHRRIEMTLRYAKVTPSHLRNEYLRAMKIIESQSPAIAAAVTSNLGINEHHPAEIIAHIIAFLNKTPYPHHKNILRRLKRIQCDIADLSFNQKFKLPVNENNYMVQ